MRQKSPAVRRVLRLRQLRREREMSQAELGRLAGGLAPSFISELESGNRNPSIDNARALAGVFGVTVDEAFAWVEVSA